MLELSSRDKLAARGKRKSNKHTELLLDVANSMARANNLDEALATMRDICTRVIGTMRGSVFLNDPNTQELYSRVKGRFAREIRLLNTSGVAGHVFTTGKGEIVPDAYSDPRFNRAIDAQTGFQTRNILAAPLRTMKGDLIGVAQLLNKVEGAFTEADLALVEAIIAQASVSLEGFRTIENIEKARKQELDFLNVVSEVSSELQLGPLLQKIMGAITRMLDADRSTLFLNDEKTNELFTEVGQGLGATKIRLPNHLGIAGAVFTSKTSVNIPHAYADLRFNPSFDRKTGYFTRSILCVPVANKNGDLIGVTQVLNKRGGTFTNEDEARLKAFTSQISIGLENAKLFDDVQAIKNYNESVLESMSNGVITFSEDGKVVTCNAAGGRILKARIAEMVGKTGAELLTGANAWVLEKLAAVKESGNVETVVDAKMAGLLDPTDLNVNVTIMPLRSGEKKLGSLVMIEDISNEKRMKSTMSRYMDPALADKLLAAGEEALGGQSVEATLLFSDVRGFTTLSEELGAQGIVSLLNEYFTLMVDCISDQGGMLDKFIGDAIMAKFGIPPLTHEDDEDRAVRTAIAMMRELNAFNGRRTAEGKRPIDIGIGLNTDQVVSGNIGSPTRMEYAVIGDGVNLASRLESACKEYRTHILVSENTVNKLKGTYRLREMDLIQVKGKTKTVAIYELLDYHTEESFPNMRAALQSFQAGLQTYRECKFDDAAKLFAEALSQNPDDGSAKMFIERCAYLKDHHPGENWDGVWVMKSK